MKAAKRIKNVPPYLFAQIDKKKAEMQELERKRRELEKQRQMGAKNGK